MRKTLKVLKYFAPQTKAEWICDGLGWAGLIAIAVAGHMGTLPW